MHARGATRCSDGRARAKPRVAGLPQSKAQRIGERRRCAGWGKPCGYSGSELRQARGHDPGERGGIFAQVPEVVALIIGRRPRSARPKNRRIARSSPIRAVGKDAGDLAKGTERCGRAHAGLPSLNFGPRILPTADIPGPRCMDDGGCTGKRGLAFRSELGTERGVSLFDVVSVSGPLTRRPLIGLFGGKVRLR